MYCVISFFFLCWLEGKDIDVVNLVMFGSMFHCAKTLLGLSLKLLSMMSLGVCILVHRCLFCI